MSELPEISINGETFRLGTLLPASKPDTLPRLSAAPGFRVWSRTEITDAIRTKPVKRRDQFAGSQWICNQQSLGSCNCAAAVGALRRAMAISGRNEVPLLSWEFLYAQLVDGVDQGSMLDDGMHALANGVPILDTARHPINRHYRKRDYSAEDYADARNWRAEQCYQVDTEEELATLLLSGQGAGVVAVHVGSSFAKLHRKGFAGVDHGPGNHAVMVCDVEIIDSRLAFDHGGSWGLNVHDQGYAYLDWSDHLAQTNQHHAFYAIVAANNPGGPNAI